MTGYRVGVDIGGTFTDVVLVAPDGSVSVRKLPTLPDGYGHVVANGVSALLAGARLSAGDVSEIVHGTTVATNAILEGKGARTGLLTTRGFRDVLEIRRIRSPELYNLFYEKPKPLVPRRFRLEVPERIDHTGRVVEDLDLAEAKRALQQLADAGIESLAICLLNAYANAEHERQLGDLAREICPEWDVSLSSEVLPEIREYERTSTTVINAYLRPVVRHYLHDVRSVLETARVSAPLLIMQSNGGTMSVEAAQQRPISIIESGPAAGVIASAFLAQKLGIPNVLTFDMGGTTAKASIIENGELSQTAEYEVGGGISLTSRLIKGGGYALRAPVIDIAEVGAGGGSIISLDPAGALQVGPRSAGAVPGPVCYENGGTQPTITDANVLLGYLNPEHLVGGDLKLDADASRRVLKERIAEPLGLSVDRAAYGVHLVANANMMRAVRAVSTQRGRDPRGFALFAFGGSGPVHAVELARALDLKRVVIPLSPGLFSAFGLLVAAVEHHYVRTCFRRLNSANPTELQALIRSMQDEALATLAAEGYAPRHVDLRTDADLRYAGQSFELTIPFTMELVELARNFAQEHLRTYGHAGPTGAPIDLISLRTRARVISEEGRTTPMAVSSHGIPKGSRQAYFGEFGWMDTPVIMRTDLVNAAADGPLIVEEYDATTVVPPGCTATLDDLGNIVVNIGGER